MKSLGPNGIHLSNKPAATNPHEMSIACLNPRLWAAQQAGPTVITNKSVPHPESNAIVLDVQPYAASTLSVNGPQVFHSMH